MTLLAFFQYAFCNLRLSFTGIDHVDVAYPRQIFLNLCLLLLSVFISSQAQAYQYVTKCHAELQHIQSAKGIGPQGKSRPEAKQWQAIATTPDYWNDRWPKFSGTVWYKLTWQFHCEEKQNQPMMLSVSFINMAGQVYINDHFLWQNKSLEEPLSRNWNMPRRWMLPIGILKTGENTVYIRVEGVSELNPGIGSVYIGDYESTMAKYLHAWLEMRDLLTYTLCLEIALGLIAIFVWVFRPKESAFGYYALATLLWVLYIGMNLVVEPLFALKTLDFARIQSLVFLGFVFFTCLYGWRFANYKAPQLEHLFVWLFLVFFLFIWFAPAQYLDFLLKSSFIVGVGIYLFNCLVYPIIAYRSRQPEAYCLAFVMFLVYLPLSVHDCLTIYQHKGNLLTVYASPFTAVILACIFALRLTRSMNGAERFNARLERTVKQVRTELEDSLLHSHQLELKNAKLQERIQFAHDLHDGVGSSLVRSMASIEHNSENLNNRQFLSVLKHLRDDLRLMIDYGSSLDTVVPGTPILWVAPTRHRFNQLFDELGVSICWRIPDNWQGMLTPAECIALQRVLEECLTNVLKHSQADCVEVSLSFQNQELVAVVQDNGVGFDTKAVKESGLSVGLKSMRTRLNKINAELEVESKPGCTRVTVRKKTIGLMS